MHVFQHTGFCPICEHQTTFTAQFEWFRDHLRCSDCHSIPRERALFKTITDYFPNYRDLDIQRDHTWLIKNTMRLLAPNGQLIFSNNLRGFTLDESITQQYSVENISAASIDVDFARHTKIHQCWVVRQKVVEE